MRTLCRKQPTQIEVSMMIYFPNVLHCYTSPSSRSFWGFQCSPAAFLGFSFRVPSELWKRLQFDVKAKTSKKNGPAKVGCAIQQSWSPCCDASEQEWSSSFNLSDNYNWWINVMDKLTSQWIEIDSFWSKPWPFVGLQSTNSLSYSTALRMLRGFQLVRELVRYRHLREVSHPRHIGNLGIRGWVAVRICWDH